MDVIIVLTRLTKVNAGGCYKMDKNQHVLPHPEGGWQVKGEKNEKATARTETQAEAIVIAREIAQNQKSELIIHRRNGQIRKKDSYGNDDFPPEG